MDRNQTLEKRLESRNIRPTAMRLRVMSYMMQQKATVSLADLEEFFDRADRTTLYRTLKTFEEKGMIHRIVDDTGSSKYALCSSDCQCSYPADLHPHFFCTHCEDVYCLTGYHLPEVNLPEHFTAKDATYLIKGICEACA
ncbi:MAG: transcriptional repressor [Balneolaceae bacterium]